LSYKLSGFKSSNFVALGLSAATDDDANIKDQKIKLTNHQQQNPEGKISGYRSGMEPTS